MQVTPVEEMILHIRLVHTCGFMIVVAVCAPPEDHVLRHKEEFYHKLKSVVGRCPARNDLDTFTEETLEATSWSSL